MLVVLDELVTFQALVILAVVMMKLVVMIKTLARGWMWTLRMRRAWMTTREQLQLQLMTPGVHLVLRILLLHPADPTAVRTEMSSSSPPS